MRKITDLMKKRIMMIKSCMLSAIEIAMVVGCVNNGKSMSDGYDLTIVTPGVTASYDGLDSFLETQDPNLTSEQVQKMEQFYQEYFDWDVYLLSSCYRVAGMIALID